ncbi:hypothetical protein COLO4_25782 [Corchorus olitorius]|uniref:MCAfunc domain-containing protein n=1 Tax=Corchorus olitorius TaxID=93759 RepID=A0A1R3I016_9ROSI|nr:hypothetical protein COLO4_25782 [Corchorus olitorius]
MAGGLGSPGLTSLIISSARRATTHRKNCEQLAEHVKLIGNLLQKLKSTDLVTLPAIKEPLDGLDEALKKALNLIESCRDKSCLYMLALGWNIVYQFRQVQTEIDRYLNIVPLISLVHEFRMQNLEEGLEAIKQDQREYSLDEEDVEAQSVILKPDRTKKDANILEKSLSRRYPELGFQEALQEEKEKLQVELHRSRTINDSKQCRVIEHLIDVTENVVNVVPDHKKVHKLIANEPTYVIAGYVTNAKSSCEQLDMKPEGQCESQWQGGICDDYITHLICFCCALVQEWRELEARGFQGCEGRKMIPPPYQYMKP